MIEHIWSLICSAAVIDQDTNNVSVFNILEQVTVPSASIVDNTIQINIELITLWVRKDLTSPTKGYSQVSILAPNSDVIVSFESDVDLTEFERLRNRGLIQGLSYKGEGIYNFQVHYKNNKKEQWKLVATLPLKISLS